MEFEFAPQTPEEFDGALTSEPGAGRADLDDNFAMAKHTIPKFGALSDLSRHDKELADEFLAMLA
ncbi:hypothetical protein [Nocardia crassostreae]|uniref:hypothetical protein n=1 Tax=Nocardia crassostreae TaxID=53428 RepID=UPI000833E90F|nr:hypothetical protein [Nocardia crassostreae]